MKIHAHSKISKANAFNYGYDENKNLHLMLYNIKHTRAITVMENFVFSSFHILYKTYTSAYCCYQKHTLINKETWCKF
jgi:hypothetical protein